MPLPFEAFLLLDRISLRLLLPSDLGASSRPVSISPHQRPVLFISRSETLSSGCAENGPHKGRDDVIMLSVSYASL